MIMQFTKDENWKIHTVFIKSNMMDNDSNLIQLSILQENIHPLIFQHTPRKRK